MALFRQVVQNKHTEKWAYIEVSDEEKNLLHILGNKEFDTKEEAIEWSEGFDIFSYTHKNQENIL